MLSLNHSTGDSYIRWPRPTAVTCVRVLPVYQCCVGRFSTVRGKALKGGSITVLHTHGRNGPYHPHLHVLATRGGYEAQGARWEPLQSLPYDLLRRKWQWHLLTMLRQTLATDAVKQLVDACVTRYPNGLVTNVQQGLSPRSIRAWHATWPSTS
jgi:hypothetical protein